MGATEGLQLRDLCNRYTKDNFLPNPKVGQLQTKLEPAGKLRVFAMVDVWTQSALKPLHKYLFAVLKGLPNDGTFDQHASVKRCFAKSQVAGCSFGYDLSAATDRLPLVLQSSVLAALFGADFAEAWSKLLVERDYHWSIGDVKLGTNEEGIVRYSVGQPMGALSSWGMLAITHHLITQIAAQRAGRVKPGQ